MNKDQQPTMRAALFLRDWYDGCLPLLSDADQLQLFKAVCEYTFNGQLSCALSPMVQAMWSLIRPAINNDRDKYVTRCERNRQNARGGGKCHSLPLAATRSHSQPLATNTSTTPSTTTDTTTTPNTLPISSERERFDCLGILFSRGAESPSVEVERFWNYYEALGWKNNKGANIANKCAAARQWRCEPLNETLAAARADYYAAFRSTAFAVADIWNNYIGADIAEEELTLRLRGGKEWVCILEDKCVPELRALLRKTKCTKLSYKVVL